MTEKNFKASPDGIDTPEEFDAPDSNKTPDSTTAAQENSKTGKPIVVETLDDRTSITRQIERNILSCIKRRMPGTFTITRRLTYKEISYLTPGTIVTLRSPDTTIEILDKTPKNINYIDSLRTGEKN